MALPPLHRDRYEALKENGIRIGTEINDLNAEINRLNLEIKFGHYFLRDKVVITNDHRYAEIAGSIIDDLQSKIDQLNRSAQANHHKLLRTRFR